MHKIELKFIEKDIAWQRKNTAIIAGGAQGIGPACAERLTANGGKLVLLDTDEAALTLAKE